MMAFPASLVLFFFVSRMLFIFHLVEGEDICLKEFECGKLGNISYPFTDHNKPSCGLLLVNCQRPDPQIKLWVEEDSPVDWPEIANLSPEEMQIEVPKSCFVFQDLPLPEDEYTTFTVTSSLTPLVKCTLSSSASDRARFLPNYRKFDDCEDQHGFIIYYNHTDDLISAYNGELPSGCSIIHLALGNRILDPVNFYNIFAKEISVKWNVSKPWHCNECLDGGHQCIVTQDSDSHNIYTCSANGSAIPAKHDADVKGKSKKIALLVLGLVICGIVVSIIICTYLFIKREKKKNKDGSYLLSRNMSYEPSSKAYIEDGSVRFEVPVYTYDELEKATASFNSANELGDGGFGIVYFGKLKDGREIAVKRLYEHNYRRMEQFENEINILTSLRHPNLVSLYGCTSRHSRELLLVYEFVPNGTIADHIHGNKAESKLLTWPIRMNIAVETANALAYLHKSDIIHRDVKTNNILLDHNFSVKVADFGLSRLFPLNVTHISTAPQGTPGYVDPDYHECYQLTNKSDVYSFGVVLIELISSLPAVDISRHRHEINLSNLAISKIQSNALDELIDSSLGYGSDPEVTRMTRLIAELAFRCLQVDKEMRPSMDEVVEILEAIKQGMVSSEPREVSEVIDKSDVEKGVRIHPSPESDGVVLLKNRKMPSSPMSVTEDWVSGSSSASV